MIDLFAPRCAACVLALLSLPAVSETLSEAMAREARASAVAASAPPMSTQRKTGYIPGTRRLAGGGLSSFTVDNSAGAGPAEARLYREGRKPAVRSLFVYPGERFEVRGLLAGAYVLRYRFADHPEVTFEADRLFDLREERTAEGTRYSRVRVTLYKVSDGNLTTHIVPADDF